MQLFIRIKFIYPEHQEQAMTMNEMNEDAQVMSKTQIIVHQEKKENYDETLRDRHFG